jgi:hypothetical protein
MLAVVFAWVVGFTLLVLSFQADVLFSWLGYVLGIWFLIAGFIQAWQKSRE